MRANNRSRGDESHRLSLRFGLLQTEAAFRARVEPDMKDEIGEFISTSTLLEIGALTPSWNPSSSGERVERKGEVQWWIKPSQTYLVRDVIRFIPGFSRMSSAALAISRPRRGFPNAPLSDTEGRTG